MKKKSEVQKINVKAFKQDIDNFLAKYSQGEEILVRSKFLLQKVFRECQKTKKDILSLPEGFEFIKKPCLETIDLALTVHFQYLSLYKSYQEMLSSLVPFYESFIKQYHKKQTQHRQKLK